MGKKLKKEVKKRGQTSKNNLQEDVKKEFAQIKLIFFIVLGISALQFILSIFGYGPKLGESSSLFRIFSLLVIIKTLIFFIAGYLIFLKQDFKLERIALISFLLFIPSVPIFIYSSKLFQVIPFFVKLLNFAVLLILNYFVSFSSCLIGALVAVSYKKIR